MKTYKQYLIDIRLAENFASDTTITKDKLIQVNKNIYNKLYFNQLLMENVINYNLNENFDEVIKKIQNEDYEEYNIVNKFYSSVMKNFRSEFLTPYSKDELANMNLFKLRGYNIGFAIKKDGDIVLVHNNENVKNIGTLLIDNAKKRGGDHLDHFDGFLTGFYKKCDFKLYKNNIFLDEYAPKTWKYEPLNIYDPKVSIYAEELESDKNDLIDAEIRYDNGKPDIVYRKL